MTFLKHLGLQIQLKVYENYQQFFVINCKFAMLCKKSLIFQNIKEWEDLEDEEDDEMEDEPADEISPTIQIQADNWLGIG